MFDQKKKNYDYFKTNFNDHCSVTFNISEFLIKLIIQVNW